MGIDYKSAGVDVEAGYTAVEMMKEYVKSTYDKNVLGEIGSFGGFYALSEDKDGDVLVAGTDGVGTKLKYAFCMDKHNTIGIDAVAMCVNDIICSGAKPLFFLDYIAVPKLIPQKVSEIVQGISKGCRIANCALLGGETAEMPGFYKDDEYDIAGFSCGIVKKDKIIEGKSIQKGDMIIGLASSGIHSNGYSLVRHLYPPIYEELTRYDDELGCAPCEILLEPTRIYVKPILSVIERFAVKGIAHITGGGFIENIPRMLPKYLGAKIYKDSYTVPKIFKTLQKRADISDTTMYNTFNMGIGMVVVVEQAIADKVVEFLNKMDEKAVILGEVVQGKGVLL